MTVICSNINFNGLAGVFFIRLTQFNWQCC